MRTDISKLGEYFTIQNFPRDRSVFDIKDWLVLDYYPGLTYTSSSSSSKSLGTMPVGVHCTMRKYSRINWGYYLWNAGLVVPVTVDRTEPVCVHLTHRQVSDPTPVTRVGTRTMFLYFCCPVQWISSVFPLTTHVSAPIRSSRFITYLLASSLLFTALAINLTLIF